MQKFYIRMNGAYVDHWYWNMIAQNWTKNINDMTLFDSREEADIQAEYANGYGPGEAEVCIKRKEHNE